MEIEAFALRLRALRLKAGLSQEALAARLGVSAQSVSKWENAANWPETALILPLARLLCVSADELLADPAAREEWEKRWQAGWEKQDHFALLALAEAALRDWPADREFRFRQAGEEYQAAALTEDETERTRLLRRSEEHFAALLRDCPDHEDAGTMLVQILLTLGRRAEAEALAERLPHREKLALLLRQGEARAESLRREITKTATELLNLLQTEGSREACGLTAAILSAAGQPKALIWYRLNLSLRLARLACKEGAAAGAVGPLGELVKTAREFSASAVPESASLFVGLPEEAASPAEVRRWVLDALQREDFAPLRALPGFAALSREAAALPV